VTAWAAAQLIPVDKVGAEDGCALKGHRRKVLALPGTCWCIGSWWTSPRSLTISCGL